MTDKCPKCGGSGGHCSVTVIRYFMSGGWGEQEQAGDEEVVQRADRRVTCVDCGARVPRSQAEGVETDRFGGEVRS